MELKDRHIFITGASKRIGRVLAETLLARGSVVTAHYRNSEKECLALREWAGPKRCFPVQADLTHTEQIRKAVLKSKEALGDIHVLINCASDFYATPTDECTEAQWDALQDINARAPFFLAQACAPMLIQTKGAIVNIVDIYAERPLKNFAAYTASKAALWMLTKNLAKEWAPHVRVNAVSPGAVLLPDWYTAEQRERSAKNNLLGRLGCPQDIAEAVCFILENDYLTGINLKVDGGKSLL